MHTSSRSSSRVHKPTRSISHRHRTVPTTNRRSTCSTSRPGLCRSVPKHFLSHPSSVTSPSSSPLFSSSSSPLMSIAATHRPRDYFMTSQSHSIFHQSTSKLNSSTLFQSHYPQMHGYSHQRVAFSSTTAPTTPPTAAPIPHVSDQFSEAQSSPAQPTPSTTTTPPASIRPAWYSLLFKRNQPPPVLPPISTVFREDVPAIPPSDTDPKGQAAQQSVGFDMKELSLNQKKHVLFKKVKTQKLWSIGVYAAIFGCFFGIAYQSLILFDVQEHILHFLNQHTNFGNIIEQYPDWTNIVLSYAIVSQTDVIRLPIFYFIARRRFIQNGRMFIPQNDYQDLIERKILPDPDTVTATVAAGANFVQDEKNNIIAPEDIMFKGYGGGGQMDMTIGSQEQRKRRFGGDVSTNVQGTKNTIVESQSSSDVPKL